jgi:hypothetical protein
LARLPDAAPGHGGQHRLDDGLGHSSPIWP